MKKPIVITTLTLNLLLLTFTLLLSTFHLKAQPTIQWNKSYGGSFFEIAYSMQLTTDGGYIIAGTTASNDGDVTVNKGSQDVWIVKADSLGNIQWQKSYGGTDDDIALSTQQTIDGGFIIAGFSTSNDGDVTGHHGAATVADCWIIKIDSIGNLQWEKSYGGTGDDFALSIQQATDGGYIFVGKAASLDGDVSSYLGGNSDYWVVKLDSIGNIQWQKSYGGSGDDEANSVQQTADGGYIVAGWSSSTNGDVTNPKGNNDYWIIKIDSIGILEWEKSYGGSSSDIQTSLQKTIDGGFVIAGATASVDGDVTDSISGGIWIIKIDSLGVLQWEKSYMSGFPAGFTFWSTDALALTSDGGMVVSLTITLSNNNTDYLLLKIDSLGILQWQRTMGGSGVDQARAVQQTFDGGFIVAGYSTSNDGDVTGHHGAVNYPDYWVVKLNPVVGIEELTNKNDLLVYPNPNNGIVRIKNTFVIQKITIYNNIGQIINTQTINGKTAQIDLRKYPKGIYFLTITDSKKIITQKLIYE